VSLTGTFTSLTWNLPHAVAEDYSNQTLFPVTIIGVEVLQTSVMTTICSLTPPPWAAALTSRRGLIPSEPSASAERGTGRLSAAQLAGLVWSLADSHRVVYRTRLVLGLGGWLMGPHCGLSLQGCFVQTCPFVIPDTCSLTHSPMTGMHH